VVTSRLSEATEMTSEVIRLSRLLGYQAGSPRRRLWVCGSWLFIAQRGRANRTGTIRAILHLTTILSVQGSTSDANRELQVRQ